MLLEVAVAVCVAAVAVAFVALEKPEPLAASEFSLAQLHGEFVQLF